jgi:hypothetical protein
VTGRPRLRAVGGTGPEDTVVRRRRFEAAHPDVTIVLDGFWYARRGGEVLCSAYELSDLLDELESL